MSIVRFGPYSFDISAYHLERDSNEIPVEPKVAELLALLIEQRDRVVSRHEIFDQLWPRQEVGDAALSRLIYALRKALDDDASAPSYIRTVPRRGVQFIAPLIAAEEAQPETKNTSHHRMLWGAGAMVLMVGLAVILRFTSAPSEPPADSAGPVRIGLLSGVAAGTNHDGQMVLVTVGDLLWNRLSLLPGIEVRSPFFSTILSQYATSVGAFARDSQVDYVLSLTTRPASSPDQVTIDSELIKVDGEDVLLRTPLREFELPLLNEQGDLAAFLSARDMLVQRVAEEIGMLVTGDGLEGAPSSAEAWRLYLLAREGIASLSCNSDGPRRLLERVVEIDPDFFLGWVILGSAHYNAVWACGEGRSRAQDVLAALERARALQPHSGAVTFLESVVLAELGRADEAVAAARRQLANDGNDSMAMVALSYALTYRGALDEAATLVERAVQYDPLVLTIETGSTPTVFLHLGQWSKYQQISPAGDGPVEQYYRAYAQWQSGDLSGARAQLTQCAASAGGDRFAGFCDALLRILDGQPEPAITLLKAMQIKRQAADTIDGEVDFKVAQLLAAAGDVEAAMQSVHAAWDRGFKCAPCYQNDPLLAPLRQHEAIGRQAFWQDLPAATY